MYNRTMRFMYVWLSTFMRVYIYPLVRTTRVNRLSWSGVRSSSRWTSLFQSWVFAFVIAEKQIEDMLDGRMEKGNKKWKSNKTIFFYYPFWVSLGINEEFTDLASRNSNSIFSSFLKIVYLKRSHTISPAEPEVA